MPKKLIFALFLIFTIGSPSYAQDIVFEQLSTLNGLSQNTVRCIFQDKNGFMWFGTINGLNRYDGFKFVSYKSNPGLLVDSRIRDIIQDKHGYIWIRGFSNKYNCFDPNTNKFLDYLPENYSGITFNSLTQLKNGDICLTTPASGCLYLEHKNGVWISTPIKNRTNNEKSLSDDRVVFSFEDAENNVWIGTQSNLGLLTRDEIANKSYSVLNYFDQSSGHYFTMADENPEYIYFFTRKGVVIYSKKTREMSYVESSSNTNALYAVKFSPFEYLLVTTNKSVLVFNTQKKIFAGYPQVIDASTNIIAQIIHDKNGGYWITNNTGNIWRIDSITRNISKYKLFSTNTFKLIDNERIYVLPDKSKNVWISTYGEGLYRYKKNAENLEHFVYDISKTGTLSSNYLLTLYCDKSGIVWVGTEHTGLNKISQVKSNFKKYNPSNEIGNYSSNNVRSFLQDRNGNLWVSTKDGLITVYDRFLNKSSTYTDNFIKSLNIQGNVYCFLQDSVHGWIWMGTKGNGVYAFDPNEKNASKRIKHFYREPGNFKALSIDQVYGIVPDYKGRLWFATFGGGVSMLYLSNPVQNGFTNFFTSPEGIKQVRCLLSDKNNNIWLGTSNGLIKFHPDSLINNPEKYTYYSNVLNDNKSLSNNEVKTIFQDQSNTIWIGTSNGLNRYIESSANEGEHFKHYFTTEGLANDMIQAIAQDANGNLWIGTENGFSVLHKGSNTFRNYRPTARTMGNLISELAAVRLNTGELIFGSADGFYLIDPGKFKPDTTHVPVTLTNLILSGVQVEPGSPNSVLNKAIFNTEEVVLDYTSNSFTLEFASLIYDNEHNYYSYILENYDKEWNSLVNENSAPYKNINPGKYTFKVKYSSPSGSVNDLETRLTIIIKPPLWRTKFAFFLYFTFAVIILLSIKFILDRIHKLQHTIELEKQLAQYKIKFFTNVSHEFRTPLSLILSSLERIGDTIKLTPGLYKHIQVMQRNTNRLLQLMDQLLDFAKVQNRSMKLHLNQTEVIGLIKSIYNNFFDLAEKKDITYHFSANVERSMMHVDQNAIDKILYNLLSNAFKFTGDGGQIDVIVTIDEAKKNLLLIVKDNGSGIPEDKQELIFKRFAQIHTSTTGIGLALTKELVELHHGEISFTSKPDVGTEFTVTLDTNPASFGKDEIFEETGENAMAHIPHFLQADTDETTVENDIEALNNNKILIVEDNTEIRDYLADYLSKFFIVEQAENGAVGLQKAIDWEPDLIVCDIVMPEMNGIEVTKKLKGDFQTSHIPILLLTAISSDEKKLEATEAGADEYITKPFSIKYLLTKIFKLIEQRELLRKRFSSDTNPISFTICKTDRDKTFLEKSNRIVEMQMMNTEFSVDEFAKLVGLGRTVFYKKLKGITGYTPNEFIRIVRMKKSLDYLGSGDFTVSEVAHKVGMNDPFYFSRCFKAQFGQSPSSYVKGK